MDFGLGLSIFPWLGERWDISSAEPEVAASLGMRLEEMAGQVDWAESQMARGNKPSAAPCCSKVG